MKAMFTMCLVCAEYRMELSKTDIVPPFKELVVSWAAHRQVITVLCSHSLGSKSKADLAGILESDIPEF